MKSGTPLGKSPPQIFFYLRLHRHYLAPLGDFMAQYPIGKFSKSIQKRFESVTCGVEVRERRQNPPPPTERWLTNQVIHRHGRLTSIVDSAAGWPEAWEPEDSPMRPAPAEYLCAPAEQQNPQAQISCRRSGRRRFCKVAR